MSPTRLNQLPNYCTEVTTWSTTRNLFKFIQTPTHVTYVEIPNHSMFKCSSSTSNLNFFFISHLSHLEHSTFNVHYSTWPPALDEVEHCEIVNYTAMRYRVCQINLNFILQLTSHINLVVYCQNWEVWRFIGIHKTRQWEEVSLPNVEESSYWDHQDLQRLHAIWSLQHGERTWSLGCTTRWDNRWDVEPGIWQYIPGCHIILYLWLSKGLWVFSASLFPFLAMLASLVFRFIMEFHSKYPIN